MSDDDKKDGRKGIFHLDVQNPIPFKDGYLSTSNVTGMGESLDWRKEWSITEAERGSIASLNRRKEFSRILFPTRPFTMQDICEMLDTTDEALDELYRRNKTPIKASDIQEFIRISRMNISNSATAPGKPETTSFKRTAKRISLADSNRSSIVDGGNVLFLSKSNPLPDTRLDPYSAEFVPYVRGKNVLRVADLITHTRERLFKETMASLKENKERLRNAMEDSVIVQLDYPTMLLKEQQMGRGTHWPLMDRNNLIFGKTRDQYFPLPKKVNNMSHFNEAYRSNRIQAVEFKQTWLDDKTHYEMTRHHLSSGAVIKTVSESKIDLGQRFLLVGTRYGTIVVTTQHGEVRAIFPNDFPISLRIALQCENPLSNEAVRRIVGEPDGMVPNIGIVLQSIFEPVIAAIQRETEERIVDRFNNYVETDSFALRYAEIQTRRKKEEKDRKKALRTEVRAAEAISVPDSVEDASTKAVVSPKGKGTRKAVVGPKKKSVKGKVVKKTTRRGKRAVK